MRSVRLAHCDRSLFPAQMVGDDRSALTDEDRQTPSDGQNSSDDMISEVISTIARENEQLQQDVSTSALHSAAVNNPDTLSKFNSEQTHQADDKDKHRCCFAEHVQVSRVTRASLHSLNTEMTFTESSTCARRKSTGNVLVSRSKNRRSQTINERPTDRQTSRITFRESPGHIDRTTQTDHDGLDSKQRHTATTSVVTRVPFAELPFQMAGKDPHITVTHISVSVQRKQSS